MYVCMYVCMCVCLRARARARVCVYNIIYINMRLLHASHLGKVGLYGESPDPANAAPSDTQHLGLPGGAAGAMEAFMSFGESSIPERPVCAPAAPPATSLHDDPVEEAFMEKSKGHGHSPCPFFSSFYL